MKNSVLYGFLHFHSETGTEGGYWAFQDKNFISSNTTRFSCKTCGLYWDKKIETEEKLQEKAMRHNMSHCEHSFELTCPEEYSYEGLRVLANTDNLKIFSKEKPAEIVWEGEINLKQHLLFTQHVGGLWIHSDQIGMDRDTWSRWFFDSYPAELRFG